jgi:glycosyltransferase involved in cell wall biosynthesis
MKKNCFISTYAYPLFNPKCQATFGGSEVQLFQIANKLTQNKNILILFIVGDFGQKGIETYDKVKVIKGILNRNRKSKLRFLISSIFCQFTLLKTLKKINADVYVQRSAGIDTGIISIYCKLFHKKFIYMTASSIDTDGGYHRLKPFEGIIYEWGIKHATHVICQSRDQQINLQKNYHIKATILKNSFCIPPKTKNFKDIILWVGSSQPLKQPQIFLDLATSMPNYKFVMVMPPNEQILWQQILLKTKSINNLKLIKHVPYHKINLYFSKAKIFINTSTFEGFPNTFVQATMNGTPIISLNVNPDNFINRNRCGFCAQGDFKKLKKYTKSLFTNNILWLTMSKNSYAYAKKNHDINKNIIKLTKLIDL